jgi:hypothetical protein
MQGVPTKRMTKVPVKSVKSFIILKKGTSPPRFISMNTKPQKILFISPVMIHKR